MRYFQCHAFYWKANNFSMSHLISQSNSSQAFRHLHYILATPNRNHIKPKTSVKHSTNHSFGLNCTRQPIPQVCLLFCFSNLSKKTYFQNPQCYFKIFLWGNDTRLWAGKKDYSTHECHGKYFKSPPLETCAQEKLLQVTFDLVA